MHEYSNQQEKADSAGRKGFLMHTQKLVSRREPMDHPYDTECETRHAGKVLILDPEELNAKASDGKSPSLIVSHDPNNSRSRPMLCLYDLDNETSLWVGLQSSGKYEIDPNNKKQHKQGLRDNRWMKRRSWYRSDSTILRLGCPGTPFKCKQKQKRYITKPALLEVQKNIFVSCRFRRDCKTRELTLALAVDLSSCLPNRCDDSRVWACLPCFNAFLEKCGVATG